MTAPATRRADFLMALAYATDLATGHSRDFALRSCVLAMRIAEAAGLDTREQSGVYHQALLRYVEGMSRLMLKSAKRASPMINLCSFRGLGKMAVQ